MENPRCLIIVTISTASCEQFNHNLFANCILCAGPTKCLKEQQLANSALSQNRNGNTFIPSCNPAGGYERMQCDSAVGECWCVNKMGDEEPGTRIRGKKQYCDAPGRVCACDALLSLLIGLHLLHQSLTSLDSLLNTLEHFRRQGCNG